MRHIPNRLDNCKWVKTQSQNRRISRAFSLTKAREENIIITRASGRRWWHSTLFFDVLLFLVVLQITCAHYLPSFEKVEEPS